MSDRPPDHDDRRAHQRHDLTFELEGAGDEDGVVARMRASNLSLGGLYCTSPVDYPEMTQLAIRLMLPLDGVGEPRALDIEAVVVRREPSNGTASGEPSYRLGLFFSRLDPETRGRLERFLAVRPVSELAN